MEREIRAGQTTAATTDIEERKRALRQPPSAEEIARRQAAWAEFIKVRDSIPPLDIDPVDLLRRAREEDDRNDG